ncbi:lysozyme c-1-like [Symsagittifera roscoffensis]|uniref:lysozyme c-1-like n=1 Tax=Symsagittifera roscoffensis TaxID=84072 RepID=UPI00307B4F7D
MMKFPCLLGVSILLLTRSSESKKFTLCEFARLLATEYSTPADTPLDLLNWICLAYHESALDTAATNNNTNGSRDYGIFQINNDFWCDDDRGTNDCSVACLQLLNPNISESVKCARKIFARHGFEAWYGWQQHCKGKSEHQLMKKYFNGCVL